MDKKTVLEAIKNIKKGSSKRNFKQSFDLIINLKGLDLKKPDDQVELFIPLHFEKGKKPKICVLAGPELVDEGKKHADLTITAEEFERYQKDKKAAKRLAGSFDYFIAQANIMPKVAQAFGRYLGPRGKMPNPKAGCVVPPKAQLAPLVARLHKTVRISAKTSLVVQCAVGREDMKDEEVYDNIHTVHDQLVHHLPNEAHNLDSMYLKLTMGKPVKLI
ncbi:50S ribosomal protein L1 [Candidatus Woesearchaeota archaeon]|nr:50S ribosomal protein L1 [Candidatus Woesearchaeota archaeon]